MALARNARLKHMTLVITSAAVYERNNAQGSDTRVKNTLSSSRPIQGDALAISSGSNSSSSRSTTTSDSVSVSISRNTSRALRSLSDGATYINTAEEALNNVNSLLEELDTISTSIENEVNPTQRDSLAQEGAEILSEIDRIAQETKIDTRSVFSGEPLYLSADLNGSDFSSLSKVSVSVTGLSASNEDLGLDSLDAAALESKPTSARATIADAQVIVREQLTSLENSRSGLEQSVTAFGRQSGLSDAGAITNFAQARDSAKSIVNNLTSDLASEYKADSNQLSSLRVKTLLSTPAQPEEQNKKLYQLHQAADSPSTELTND